MEQVDLGSGTMLAPRLPVALSLAPQPDSGPPPRLGQHGREILAEAGFDDGEIAALARDGIVQLP
jgi:crotonobetainyl-CoA:carnitine CoA-transferase CaiB-like acyl-CoA transferase